MTDEAREQALAGLERLRQRIEALPAAERDTGGAFVLAVVGTIRRWIEEDEAGRGPFSRGDAAQELMSALAMSRRRP